MKDVVKLRAFGIKIGVKMPKKLRDCPEHELRTMGFYNGAGPDWFPEWGRVLTSFFLRIFAVAVMIHDWHFHHSDKKVRTFTRVNREFYDNMMIIVKYHFGGWFLGCFGVVYNYWAGKAYIAYIACKNAGWSAWLD